ncbi:hypothetical protein [Niabella sp.]|uniref:hypothetical protein n=1 Tax=Niabella sp. TaxID=1962976 RepID=UPI0026026C87|nr:hypothetical protein [Niabella sp.]
MAAGLFLLIGGLVAGLILILVGIIRLFGKDEKAIEGRKTVLIGFILLVFSGLVGFSICSGAL